MRATTSEDAALEGLGRARGVRLRLRPTRRVPARACLMGGPRRSLSAGHVCAAARGIGVVCGVGVSGVCGTALWSRWPYLGSRSSFPRGEAPPPWSLPEAGPRAESRLPRAVTSPRSEGESALAVFLRHVRGLEAHDFAQVLQKPEPSHLSCQRRRWLSPKLRASSARRGPPGRLGLAAAVPCALPGAAGPPCAVSTG